MYMGPSRARAHTATHTPLKAARPKPCPQCPAQAHRSCLRWVGERRVGEVVRWDGRWERAAGPHPARTATNPADPKYVQFLDPARQGGCDNTSTHRSHGHGDSPELWCRGRM